MKKTALFLCGGWEGHDPEGIVGRFARALEEEGFETRIERDLAAPARPGVFEGIELVFPCWTMGRIEPEVGRALCEAVRGGVGLGGIHGGMGDAFRGDIDYEWMVGGHFVGHPHVGEYTVRIRDFEHPITQGLPASFGYRSEQYYMLVDPGVHVLADTDYLHEGRIVRMPVAWVKQWGRGRVFYSALGHAPAEFDEFPAAELLTVRGLLWAAGASSI